jgi:hypothetical protein
MYQESSENCMTRRLTICAPHQIIFDDQIKEDVMAGIYSMCVLGTSVGFKP